MSKKLTSAELKLISDILKEAAEMYSDHSCNDYEIPNTKANKEVLINMNKSGLIDGLDEEEEIELIKSCKDKNLFTMDFVLMEYLAERCKEAAK